MPIELIDDMRQMDAVYWPVMTGGDGRTLTDDFGRPVLSSQPRAVKVYWLDSTEEVVAGDGSTRTSRATVYGGEDMPEGSYLWRGLLSQVPQANRADPRRLYGAFPVVRFDKIATLDFDQYLRRAYL